MDHSGLILTLAGGLSAALLLGYLAQRIGLSPIVGYLVAGMLVGPHTPGFVANTEYAEQLAEIGVILLLFGVGLELHIGDLIAMRGTAVPGALLGMSAAALAGTLGAHAFGWSWLSATVFGLTISISSTAVLVRVLSDSNQLHTRVGHIAIAWLVVEDILTVLVLVLLPTLAQATPTPATIAVGAGIALGKIAALGVVAVPLGQYVVPRLLDRVAATASRELFTLAILVLALGIAVAAALLFGVSIALGAFVAGMVVGRSDYSLRAIGDALPMRDVFAVLFFVSVGMLVNPMELPSQIWLLVIGLAVVLFVKPLVAMITLLVGGHSARVALTVPTALAQIGEFSFILVTLASRLQLIPAGATNIAAAIAILSIIVNPIGARFVPRAERWMGRWTSRSAAGSDLEPESSSLEAADRAVVVGYGPTGQTASRLLRENGIAPTIVDLNLATVRDLRQQNVSAVYGDARVAETLISSGIRHAGTLIVSAAMPEATEIVRRAKELNPEVRVLARGAYVRDVPSLRSAGAEETFSGEGEVALAMTEAVLKRLGAAPEQIDRERARVRRDLFGSST